MSTFLTADTHFGHASIIKHCNRPFASAEEMDARLIANWNAVVHPREVVWHLGDFGCGDAEHLARIFNALNGDKRLVLGNHDTDKKGQVLKSIRDLNWTKITQRQELNHAGRRIVLDHYAGLTWNAQHHGAYQAFGHSHAKLIGMPGAIDVGVDAQNYRPITVEEFIRQADATILDAETRLATIAERMLGKSAFYTEKAETVRARQNPAQSPRY